VLLTNTLTGAEVKRIWKFSASEELLESFASAALGRELKSRIEGLSVLPLQSSCCGVPGSGSCARVSWNSARGDATLRGGYDETQSPIRRSPVTSTFLQIRNGAIHIVDYKPSANTEEPIPQFMVYALALSRRTGAAV
jgi:hypothetical protein